MTDYIFNQWTNDETKIIAQHIFERPEYVTLAVREFLGRKNVYSDKQDLVEDVAERLYHSFKECDVREDISDAALVCGVQVYPKAKTLFGMYDNLIDAALKQVDWVQIAEWALSEYADLDEIKEKLVAVA